MSEPITISIGQLMYLANVDRMHRTLTAVLPDLLARAWDEGYRLDWTGGVRHPNPYRQEAESA